MVTTNRIGQIVVCLAVCVFVASGAIAASARNMAIGRAFSYAYNNPQPQAGEGPMGSSMYYGNTTNAPPVIGGAPPLSGGMDSPLTSSSRSTRVYTPLAPATIVPSGSSSVTAYAAGSSYANPVRETISVLSERDKEGFALEVPPLTSLAPRTPGACRDAMLRGETAFRQGKLDDAAKSFETARVLSKNSAESLLSLVHVQLAQGEKQYDPAAANLAKVLQQVPGLMQVRVRPKDFFASADEYKKSVAALEAYVKANPKDAGAMLLLGYVQYRDGQIDDALNTAESGIAASPAKELEAGLAALYEGILRSGQVVAAGAPPMEKAKDYAWAGISVAFPKGFKPAPLASPNQVAIGIIDNGKDVDPHQVSLYAYNLGEGDMTLTGLMDFMMNSIRRSPTIKDMTTEAEAEVPFQTGEALVRLFRYVSGEAQTKTYMGWVAFIREPKDKKGPRIAYLLGLATTEKQSDKLLPTLAAIAKTVTMSEAVSPSLATIEMRGDLIQDSQYAFSITQPWGWSGRSTDKGFEMGQMDFTRNNCVSPKVEVIVQTVPGAQTPKTLIEAAIERKAPQGMTRKVLSQGPTKLAGQDGYQVVGTQTPEEGSPGPSSILVCRVTCVDLPDGHKKMYAIVVNCRDAQAKDAESLADKIGSGLQILKADAPAADK